MRAYLLGLIGMLAALANPAVRAAEVTRTKPVPDIVGWYYWEMPNISLQVLIKISRDSGGRLRVTADNIARGEKGRPARAVFYDPPHFRFEYDPFGYEVGRLSDDGSKLESVYYWGELIFPYSLQRVDPSRFPEEPELTYQPGGEGTPRLGGIWNGTMPWKGTRLRQVLRIGRAPDGSMRGTLDMVDQGERGIPLTAVSLADGVVRLECKPWSIVYSGRLSDDGHRLDLNFESGAKAAPITFERGSAPWKWEDSLKGDSTLPGDSPGLAGDWVGIIDMQSTSMRLTLRVRRSANGGYQIWQHPTDDPGPVPSPALLVAFDPPNLKSQWMGSDFSKVTLNARLDGTKNRLIGTWESWGTLNPIMLERTPSGGDVSPRLAP